MGVYVLAAGFSGVIPTILPSLIVLAVAILTIYLITSRNPSNYPPGPCALPIIGNLIQVGRAKNFYSLLKELKTEYGNVFRLQMGRIPMIFIFGADNVHAVMVENAKASIDRPDWMFVPTVITKKKGITWSSGQKWQNLHGLIKRTQLTESVKATMQDQFGKELNEACKSFSPDSATDPLGQFQTTALNIVSILIFGKRFDYVDLEFKELTTSIHYVVDNGQSLRRRETFISCLAYFTKSKVAKVIEENDKIFAFIRRKLEEHKVNHIATRPRDLLDVYLALSDEEKREDSYSEENVFQSIVDLFSAGYEAYTSAMLSVVFYLIKYPDVQRKCREEILQQIGNNEVTLGDREKLPYFESTIKEVLRVTKPIVTTIYRTNSEHALSVGGYTIPPRSVLVLDLMEPQTDQSLWENPEKFNPDRWIKSKRNIGFIPFGTGPRTCVGAPTAEYGLFLFISNMIRKYQVTGENAESLNFDQEYTGISIRPKSFKIFLRPVQQFNSDRQSK